MRTMQIFQAKSDCMREYDRQQKSPARCRAVWRVRCSTGSPDRM